MGMVEVSDLATDEISEQFGKPLVLTVGPSIFEHHVAALGVTSLAQAPAKGRQATRALLGRTRMEDAYDRN